MWDGFEDAHVALCGEWRNVSTSFTIFLYLYPVSIRQIGFFSGLSHPMHCSFEPAGCSVSNLRGMPCGWRPLRRRGMNRPVAEGKTLFAYDVVTDNIFRAS